MLPGILLCSLNPRNHSKKKKSDRESLDTDPKDIDYWYSVQFNRDPPPRFTLRSENNDNNNHRSRSGEFCKTKKRGEMSNKVSNFSDLIQRMTASCLLHPLSAGRQDLAANRRGEYDSEDEIQYEDASENENGEEEGDETVRGKIKNVSVSVETVQEMEMVMEQVFTAAAALKRAYVALQDAHSPWDPEKMHEADVAMVAELRRIGTLRERFRRMRGTGGRRKTDGGRGMLREAVAPYEAVVKELKKEAKVKDNEIENLKEKVKAMVNVNNGNGNSIKKHHRLLSSRKVNCTTQVAVSPVPELFEMTMIQVKEASKSFTGVLLSLMRAARWDIAAAVRSIEAASAASDGGSGMSTASSALASSSVPNGHAKFALESYICRKIFQGFDHETFYMDGSLSSLINPDQYRRDCFAQFKDMKAMEPMELLGILPTCHFGKFCSKKYLSIIHHKMEESLFGDSEQREMVLAGSHPRSQFYGEFLGLAKAVWLLHLLAFSLDPSPSHFEANRGAEFHSQYMESVVRFPDGRVPAGQVVGFPVCPGFKLSHQGKGSIIKSRVYLVPRA
ncbi:unnamed protein product [Eruca vesicaria subsp. sativa]|uniref:DUF641 domain-containing protein n=1 Tax=Eruca vesicaria subsp. sativa TaxID=29727 RepID=A0ABC8J6U7_ERUVS|nr:unnamed protein product [Eruca vesicaria subsp. sativa]